MKFTQEHEEIRRTMKKFIDAEINPHVDARTVRPVQFGVART